MEKCLEGRKELKETANLLHSPKCPQRSESKQKQVKCQKLNFLKANKQNRFKKKNPPERKRAYGLNLGSSCFISIQVTPLEHPHFSTVTVDAKVQLSPPREYELALEPMLSGHGPGTQTQVPRILCSSVVNGNVSTVTDEENQKVKHIGRWLQQSLETSAGLRYHWWCSFLVLGLVGNWVLSIDSKKFIC